jgi:hypothetical protein
MPEALRSAHGDTRASLGQIHLSAALPAGTSRIAACSRAHPARIDEVSLTFFNAGSEAAIELG